MRRTQSVRETSSTVTLFASAAITGLGLGLMAYGTYILFDGFSSNNGLKRRLAIHIRKNDVIHKHYQMLKELGTGGTCVVWEAVDLITKKHVAVKVIAKSACTAYQKMMIINEIEIMERMNKSGSNPQVVNMIEKIENSEYFFIVMDLCTGGELYHRLSKRGQGFPEKKAKIIAKQLVDATIYMHGQGIMHRDLKPENVVFTTKDENSTWKRYRRRRLDTFLFFCLFPS